MRSSVCRCELPALNTRLNMSDRDIIIRNGRLLMNSATKNYVQQQPPRRSIMTEPTTCHFSNNPYSTGLMPSRRVSLKCLVLDRWARMRELFTRKRRGLLALPWWRRCDPAESRWRDLRRAPRRLSPLRPAPGPPPALPWLPAPAVVALMCAPCVWGWVENAVLYSYGVMQTNACFNLHTACKYIISVEPYPNYFLMHVVSYSKGFCFENMFNILVSSECSFI